MTGEGTDWGLFTETANVDLPVNSTRDESFVVEPDGVEHGTYRHAQYQQAEPEPLEELRTTVNPEELLDLVWFQSHHVPYDNRPIQTSTEQE